MKENKFYEGEDVPDGEYPLGQLSKPRSGRIKKDADEMYNPMQVAMDQETFDKLFKYCKGHWKQGFTAVVKDHRIIHVY